MLPAANSMIRSASSNTEPTCDVPFVIHQQDQVANGEGRTSVCVVGRVPDHKRIHGERRNLLNSGILELVCEVHVDSTEYGSKGRPRPGSRQSTVPCQQVLVEVGDLLLGG